MNLHCPPLSYTNGVLVSLTPAADHLPALTAQAARRMEMEGLWWRSRSRNSAHKTVYAPLMRVCSFNSLNTRRERPRLACCCCATTSPSTLSACPLPKGTLRVLFFSQVSLQPANQNLVFRAGQAPVSEVPCKGGAEVHGREGLGTALVTAVSGLPALGACEPNTKGRDRLQLGVPLP